MTSALNGLLAQISEAQTISTTGLINALVPLVQLVGVCTILWGVYSAVTRQIALETALARGQTPKTDGASLRPPFVYYLSLGLEFMIAASAIKTLVAPDLQQIGVLGGIVLTRALVGLYPRWENAKPLLPPVALGTTEALAARGVETPSRINAPADAAMGASVATPVTVAAD
jgi:uncharacterized membrane protein